MIYRVFDSKSTPVYSICSISKIFTKIYNLPRILSILGWKFHKRKGLETTTKLFEQRKAWRWSCLTRRYAKITITQNLISESLGVPNPEGTSPVSSALEKIRAEWKSIYKLVPFPHHFDSPKLGKMMRLILGSYNSMDISVVSRTSFNFFSALCFLNRLNRKENKKLPPLLSFSWPLPDWQFSQRPRRLHVVGSWHSIMWGTRLSAGGSVGPRDCWTAGLFHKGWFSRLVGTPPVSPLSAKKLMVFFWRGGKRSAIQLFARKSVVLSQNHRLNPCDRPLSMIIPWFFGHCR